MTEKRSRAPHDPVEAQCLLLLHNLLLHFCSGSNCCTNTYRCSEVVFEWFLVPFIPKACLVHFPHIEGAPEPRDGEKKQCCFHHGSIVTSWLLLRNKVAFSTRIQPLLFCCLNSTRRIASLYFSFCFFYYEVVRPRAVRPRAFLNTLAVHTLLDIPRFQQSLPLAMSTLFHSVRFTHNNQAGKRLQTHQQPLVSVASDCDASVMTAAAAAAAASVTACSSAPRPEAHAVTP
jgi:hypothetical protein